MRGKVKRNSRGKPLVANLDELGGIFGGIFGGNILVFQAHQQTLGQVPQRLVR